MITQLHHARRIGQRSDYPGSAIYWQPGPFSMGMMAAENAMCDDGKRRNAYPSHDGIADTFFSIPAYVNVKGKRVYGYVSLDDDEGVTFHAYTYRKHHQLVEKG